jgi:hypothetical protein
LQLTTVRRTVVPVNIPTGTEGIPMTPTDPNVSLTQTVTDLATTAIAKLTNPFRSELLYVAGRVADALTDPTSFHIDMVGSNTPHIRIYAHQNETAARALATTFNWAEKPVSVNCSDAHLTWDGTVARVPVTMTTLVDIEDWLRRTVDDFDQLPEQGPFYSAPPLARQFARTFTSHELRLDQLLAEAAAAEDVRPRDEELITARYAAARRYAKAAGLTFGGCICGRAAEHAPTPACVWKARPAADSTGPQAIADMPAEPTHYRVVDLGTPGAPHHKVLRDGDQVTGHHAVGDPLPGC